MDENIPALSKWCCLEAFKYLRASKRHSFVTPVYISIGFQWFSSGLSCFEEKHHLHITPSSQPTTLKTATYPTVCPFPKKPPAGTQPQDSETPKKQQAAVVKRPFVFFQETNLSSHQPLRRCPRQTVALSQCPKNPLKRRNAI